MTELAASPHPLLTSAAPVAVSVCIANWNCRDLLRNCLQSLFDCPQGLAFEVIVTDNGSTDGAAEMVAREFPQVRLIRNATNRGFGIANNQAAAIAQGEYLFFLNNDTRLEDYTLLNLAGFLREHPNVGMVGPRLLDGHGRNQISYRRRPTLPALLHRISLLRWTRCFRRAYHNYRRRDYRPASVQDVEILMGAAVMLPRAVFQACGGWDEQFRFGVEDIDLSTRVARHRRRVVFHGKVAITHLGREASRCNIQFASPNVAVGYVRYLRKTGTRPSLLAVYKLLVTLDAPLQLMGKLFQGVHRWLRGRPVKAQKSWLAARGLWGFLRYELGRFWAA